jgi:hypothetical protein
MDKKSVVMVPQTMDIVDIAIQQGTRESQSFVLKILHLNFGKLSLKTITDP